MNSHYNRTLEKIEEEISKVIPGKATHQWLYDAIGGFKSDMSIESADNINRPALDLLYRGGKRWRPMVLILTAVCLGGDEKTAVKLSPFVELIHNGTLLIDDIEDNAIERRGKKAVHLIYGDDMAINSGNHLYFLPTTIIESLKISDSIKLRIYKSYTQNMRRLHFGQGLDIQWHKNIEKIPTVDEYMQMCRFKTGCLASMSGELGAICANLPESETEAIRKIWENIGVGFQIMDDIKNITTGNPGKHRGDDIVEGKKSLPVILFCNNNNQTNLLKNIEKAKVKGIKKGKKYVDKAISILEESGVIQNSSDIALQMLKENINKLENILESSIEKDILIGIVKNFIDKII